MNAQHIKIGFIGEKAVLNHLVRKGYSHVESNFRAKTGEIDVILKKGKVVHFVEVKTVSREIKSFGSSVGVSHETHRPEDNVHRDKLRKLFSTIQIWLSLRKYKGDWQLDVAAVVVDRSSKRATVRIIDNVIVG